MDIAIIGAAISAGKSLVELGQLIAQVVKKAEDSLDVGRSILLYLGAAQAAVNVLGIERQHILTDVRRCDVGNSDQVEALWVRLDKYLHEDNIRPQLDKSIRGLDVCGAKIEKKAKGAWWRKRDKDAAVKAFSTTLHELESTLRGLTSNFYPGGSGMGIQTLVPIYNSISKVRDEQKHRRYNRSEIRAMNEELGELTRDALRDSSHEDWWRTGGKVEALVAELQLTFSINVTKKAANGS